MAVSRRVAVSAFNSQAKHELLLFEPAMQRTVDLQERISTQPEQPEALWWRQTSLRCRLRGQIHCRRVIDWSRARWKFRSCHSDDYSGGDPARFSILERKTHIVFGE